MEDFITTLIVLIIIACLAKVVLFFVFKSKRDKLPFLFHYPYPVIVLTENKTKQKIKKIQNRLSHLICLLLLLFGVLYFITKSQEKNSPAVNALTAVGVPHQQLSTFCCW